MSAIYLKEASLTELLAEIERRFDSLNPLPEWAAPVVFAVAAYYGTTADQLRSIRRTDTLVIPRHLAIALLAQFHPNRTRAEVCSVLNRGHEMYVHAVQRTDERIRRFPEFRAEVKQIHQIASEAYGTHSHCRTSPQVVAGCKAASAPSAQNTTTPV